MKIKYMGKLDPETNPLPTNKLKEGAIRFNELMNRKKTEYTNKYCYFYYYMYYVCTRIFKCSF